MPSPRLSNNSPPPLSSLRTTPRFPAPGVFLSVEFGVSLSSNSRPRIASMSYTSRNMTGRLDTTGEGTGRLRTPDPSGLPPDYSLLFGREGTQRQLQQQQQQEQGRRRRRHYRFRGWNREQHPRGRSAPPPGSDRADFIPPHHPTQQPYPFKPTASSFSPPNPPTPSQFRLGDASFPWSTPPFYSTTTSSSSPEFPDHQGQQDPADRRSGNLEDPQRIEHLSTLGQAMMTVDTLDRLDQDGWEMWSWPVQHRRNEEGTEGVEGEELDEQEEMGIDKQDRSLGEARRSWNERSVGWAVRDGTVGRSREPPPYVVSQWEEMDGRRRRCSG